MTGVALQRCGYSGPISGNLNYRDLNRNFLLYCNLGVAG